MSTEDPRAALEYYLERFKRGDEEKAWFGLREAPSEVVPLLIEAFHAVTEVRLRAFIVSVVWQRRDADIVAFLASALAVPEPLVWKEALDGLVAAGANSLGALQSARQSADAEKSEWIDEAIEQINEAAARSEATKPPQPKPPKAGAGPATSAPHCRLYVLLARSAPVGVILRRGPTKHVRLIKWSTDSETFEEGQWFKGRIYERRCDVSPDGKLFVYFASKFPGRADYTYAWTAVSKPPFFTALALWPKGDCWHGGGVFTSNRELWLNHGESQAAPHPQHAPKGLRVIPNPSARGEDYPVWSKRMTASGWTQVSAGDYRPERSGLGWRTVQEEIWERRQPAGHLTLTQTLKRIDFQVVGGPYVEEFAILTPQNKSIVLPEADWADWDHAGRLVFSRRGQLLRGEVHADSLREQVIADFSLQRFEQIQAPEWAERW